MGDIIPQCDKMNPERSGMAKDYVERRHDSFYVPGTGVPLARIVWEFRNGESAETIRAHFPVLTLEEVYGSITFYLANKDEAEKDLSVARSAVGPNY
jgi:uncharacterized protein (DUF433 family)